MVDMPLQERNKEESRLVMVNCRKKKFYFLDPETLDQKFSKFFFAKTFLNERLIDL